MPDLREAYAACERIARSRLENFPVLSGFLPADLTNHFAAVYAYCRSADDAADELESRTALDELEKEVERCFDGTPKTLPMLALQATIREKRLPREPFLDLLSAFRQDQEKKRYATWAELLDYCRRSANPVGRLVLGVLEEPPDPEKLRLSDAICTGLQLANFLQDVGKDFAKGRIYVPASDLARHGVTLEEQRATPAFRALMAELCDRTEPLFIDGGGLADLVAKRVRIPILAFAIAGQELLARIRAADFDVFSRRPEIGALPLKSILAKAAAARFLPLFRPKRRA